MRDEMRNTRWGMTDEKWDGGGDGAVRRDATRDARRATRRATPLWPQEDQQLWRGEAAEVTRLEASASQMAIWQHCDGPQPMKDDGVGHRRCEMRDARWGVEDGGGERCKLGYAGGEMMEWEIADEG